MMKFITSLALALVLFVTAAPPALAKKAPQNVCQPRTLLINPSDTQTHDCVNLIDNTFTANSTFSTCHTSEDWFISSMPLKFWGLRVDIDTAPGTTGGTDTREIAVAWDPPGAGALTTSSAASTSSAFGCTLSGTATSCVDPSSDATTVPANSPLTIRASSSTSPSAPDAGSELRISFCVAPTAQP